MIEKEVRSKLSEYIINRVDMTFKKILREINNDYRYLVLYPLLFLEEIPFENNISSIDNQLKRSSISWFLRKTSFLYPTLTIKGGFNHFQYKKFKNKFYPLIKTTFQDYKDYLEICDHWSYSKSLLEHFEGNIWNLKTPLVLNKYKVENFYYYRTFDLDFGKREKYKIQELDLAFLDYIMTNKIPLIGEFIFDESLFQLCLDRLNFDFYFLGDNLNSAIIKDYSSFKKVLTSIFYMAHIKLSRNKIHLSFRSELDYKASIFAMKKETLINNIYNISKIEKDDIEPLLEYLCLRDKGTLFEFPLIDLQGVYYFNPVSIIVNDWHFSITNGHYFKEIIFSNKDEMVSSQVILLIEKAVNDIENFVILKEKYYEFYKKDGKMENSDIDFAIYDIENNKLLILECKWRDNHYIHEMDYDHVKIQKNFFRAYKKQLNKHKEFLKNKEVIDEVFNNDKRIKSILPFPEIEFLLIDKRNQLFLKDERMMSVYMFISLINNFRIQNNVNLNSFFNEIHSLKTTTIYNNSITNNQLEIDKDLTVMNDLLFLDSEFDIL